MIHPIIERNAHRTAQWAVDQGFTERENPSDWKQIESCVTGDLVDFEIDHSANTVEEYTNYTFDLIEEEMSHRDPEESFDGTERDSEDFCEVYGSMPGDGNYLEMGI